MLDFIWLLGERAEAGGEPRDLLFGTNRFATSLRMSQVIHKRDRAWSPARISSESTKFRASQPPAWR
jgi:hypothetical protein